MVEPVDVFEGCVLEMVKVPPWSFLSDDVLYTDDGFPRALS